MKFYNYFPLVFCVVGAIIFCLEKKDGNLKMLAKDAFWIGLFITLYQAATGTL